MRITVSGVVSLVRIMKVAPIRVMSSTFPERLFCSESTCFSMLGFEKTLGCGLA